MIILQRLFISYLVLIQWPIIVLAWLNPHSLGDLLLGLVLSFVPLGFCIFRIKVGWDRKKAFSTAARDYDYQHYEHGCGIAISHARSQVLLADGGTHKVYVFDQVRKWEARDGQATSGMAVAGSPGMVAGATALTALSQAGERHRTQGLFVYVQDIDRPMWRVSMKKSGQRDRWMEILTQLINER